MATGTVICWVAWLFVLFNVSPDQAGLLGFLFFYTSLFLGIVGLFSVVGFLTKKRIAGQNEIIFRQVRRTFKQGILFACFVIIALILRQFSLLYWWNAIFLILLYLIMEGVLLSARKYSNRDYV